MTKECKKCGAEKPLEAFYVDKAKRDGRASWCSVCTKERMRQWEQQNRARVNERTAANYRRNLEESRAKARAKKARRDERLREQRRDEFAPNLCAYCLAPATDYDHIEPIVLGGSDHWSNLAPACRSCNSRKNGRNLLQFMLAKLEESV
jgi:5-methylcytosine-specific restriction endonuclease McrA